MTLGHWTSGIIDRIEFILNLLEGWKDGLSANIIKQA